MPLSRDIITEFSEWLVAVDRAADAASFPLYQALVKVLLRIEAVCGQWPMDQGDSDLSTRHVLVEVLYSTLTKHLDGDRRLPLENLRHRMTRADKNVGIYVGADAAQQLSSQGCSALARSRMYLKRLSLEGRADVSLFLRLLGHISTGSKSPVEAALHIHDIFMPDSHDEYLAKLGPLYLRLNGILQEHGLPDLLPLAELQVEADRIRAKLGIVISGAKPVSAPSFGLDT